ncbi:hypothetical protein ABT075_46765 [Streptomyces sp. NPDC002677]|uniref:hypothetical protein n=1 Tax=Streptomyces sp. NPDC002677 TaxID=3154774 RepID=UPI0033203DA0
MLVSLSWWCSISRTWTDPGQELRLATQIVAFGADAGQVLLLLVRAGPRGLGHGLGEGVAAPVGVQRGADQQAHHGVGDGSDLCGVLGAAVTLGVSESLADAGGDALACLGECLGQGQALLLVHDVEHVCLGAACAGLGHGGDGVSVLHCPGDPTAGPAVDEPGDGVAKAAQGNGAVRVVRDQLVRPAVSCGRP